ncbi:MAG TPA: lysophospholipid acyltransferase family protein [Gammaproteobacteria bacterium]
MTAGLITLLLFIVLVVAWLYLLRLLDRARGAEWGHRWVNRIDGLNRLYCRRYHRLIAEPLALPQEGPAIVVANHVSGLDPLLLAAASPRPLRFIIASEEYHRFGLTWLFRAARCIPVDRTGRPERAFRAALAALKEGEVVALFPQGRIYRDHEVPHHLKPGATRLAQMTRAPIYPYRIEGIAGEGTVFSSLWRRSRARLTHYPPIICQPEAAKQCHHQLEALMRQHLVPGESGTSSGFVSQQADS